MSLSSSGFNATPIESFPFFSLYRLAKAAIVAFACEAIRMHNTCTQQPHPDTHQYMHTQDSTPDTHDKRTLLAFVLVLQYSPCSACKHVSLGKFTVSS